MRNLRIRKKSRVRILGMSSLVGLLVFSGVGPSTARGAAVSQFSKYATHIKDKAGMREEIALKVGDGKNVDKLLKLMSTSQKPQVVHKKDSLCAARVIRYQYWTNDASLLGGLRVWNAPAKFYSKPEGYVVVEFHASTVFSKEKGTPVITELRISASDQQINETEEKMHSDFYEFKIRHC